MCTAVQALRSHLQIRMQKDAVYTMSTSMIHVCLYVFVRTNALLLQLAGLYLGKNQLEGTLPESWSHCNNVSHYSELTEVAAVGQSTMSIWKDFCSRQPHAPNMSSKCKYQDEQQQTSIAG